MPLELLTVPCLTDNYAYLIYDPATGQTAVVDVPDPQPILTALAARGWNLTDILITHHHSDHTAGVEVLRTATGARVRGAAADAHRLPRLDEALTDASRFPFGSDTVQVIDAPGHTLGHIAFFLPTSGYAFTGDSLMSAGCGRLFEGTAADMHATLRKFATLPPATLICSGHEYTQTNLRFAVTIDPDNPALAARIARATDLRSRGEPTVPVPLADELATNPFLRTHLPQIKSAVGLPHAPDVAALAALRALRDKF